MYIKTKDGWRRLWDVALPTLQEVKDRVAWGASTSVDTLLARQDWEREQHRLLLDLRSAVNG